MDWVNDPKIQMAVFMKSAQVGATEILNNIVGYYIAHDPCPILVMQPNLDMSEAWSKDRLAPMVRDTPALKDKVSDPKTRSTGNTLKHKVFPGGHCTITGANSAAGLASRPIRVLLCDEPDRYPASAGTEGDPINLARKRTTTFWNRKIFLCSTPTIKGFSRIEVAFEMSDQRYYMVPCPHCEEKQRLTWEFVKWPDGHPEQAYYACKHCGSVINDTDKHAMLTAGEWEATQLFNGTAGFHINEIYSPWVTFGEMAVAFLEAKKLPETLQTWVNTALGETWEEEGKTADEGELLARRETYTAEVPAGTLVITAGVDTQDDRLEIEVIGWGKDSESWSIEYNVIYGDPARNDIWNQLDQYLMTRFEHECGAKIPISAVGIDTGGHHTQQVYKYCKNRFRRRVYALKGVGGMGKPIMGKPSRNNLGKVHLFSVGVDTLKSMLFSRLKIRDPGPGYCHFPAHYDEEYFNQLTGEKLITRYIKGRAVQAWIPKSSHQKVEALDCRNYGTAVLELLNPNYDVLEKRMLASVNRVPESTEKTEDKSPIVRKRPKKSNWATNWKD